MHILKHMKNLKKYNKFSITLSLPLILFNTSTYTSQIIIFLMSARERHHRRKKKKKKLF